MEKADYYAALGLEIPAEQPEAAEPAAVEATGENEQSVTETAAEEGENGQAGESSEKPAEGAAQDAEHTGEGANGRTVMSKAERAEQARRRRQREQDAAVQAAVQAERQRGEQELSQILSAAGLTNRYRDGAKITNAQEFKQWQQDAAAQQRSQRLQAGQLTNEDLQAAIEESPAMDRVRQLSEQMQQAQQQEQRRQFQAQVDLEMEQIRQMDPSIHSLTDILQGPGGQEFADLVNEKNLSFVEAFKLTHYDKLVSAQQQAAQLGAARAAHSKDHLTSYGANSGEGVRVPKEVREFYRIMRPDLTDEQIRRDYAKRHPK
jgi:hypothetical protein